MSDHRKNRLPVVATSNMSAVHKSYFTGHISYLIMNGLLKKHENIGNVFPWNLPKRCWDLLVPNLHISNTLNLIMVNFFIP